MADKLRVHFKLDHLLAICGQSTNKNNLQYSESIENVNCGVCKRMIEVHKMSKEEIFQAEYLRKRRSKKMEKENKMSYEIKGNLNEEQAKAVVQISDIIVKQFENQKRYSDVFKSIFESYLYLKNIPFSEFEKHMEYVANLETKEFSLLLDNTKKWVENTKDEVG